MPGQWRRPNTDASRHSRGEIGAESNRMENPRQSISGLKRAMETRFKNHGGRSRRIGECGFDRPRGAQPAVLRQKR